MIRPRPQILVFAGSTRAGSLNARLAARIVKSIALRDADVRLISLADYPLPLYDGDLEAESGVPENAVRLRELILAHQGVVIVTPEYNQSVPPLLKNTIDWISRLRPAGEQKNPWKNRVYALAAASPGHFAGIRSLLHLRQILEVALGCQMLPEQVALPEAGAAFDPAGDILNDSVARQIERLTDRLLEEAARYG